MQRLIQLLPFPSRVPSGWHAGSSGGISHPTLVLPNKPGQSPSPEEGTRPPARPRAPRHPAASPPSAPSSRSLLDLKTPARRCTRRAHRTARKGRPGGKPVLPQPPGWDAGPTPAGSEEGFWRGPREERGEPLTGLSLPFKFLLESSSFFQSRASPTSPPAFPLPYHAPERAPLLSPARLQYLHVLIAELID